MKLRLSGLGASCSLNAIDIHQQGMHLLQAAKAAGDQAQAACGGQIPPYPGLNRRVPSSARLADMASSYQTSRQALGELL